MKPSSIDRRSFLREAGAGAAVLTLPWLTGYCTGSGKKPNILFIMSDDHACRAISAYDRSLINTPHIDRLAQEGVRFDSGFCTNSICAPSRAVLLTGKYSHENGVIDNRVVFDGTQETFPKILRIVGYETAIIGKWHLKSDPTGFDYWNILPGQGHYYNPDFIEMGEKNQHQGYVTDLITNFALGWLKRTPKDKPFCLMLHHKAPHRNWMPAPRHLDLFRNREFPLPETYFDDYETRGVAAREQEMRVADNMTMAYDLKYVPPGEFSGKDWKQLTSRLSNEERHAWEQAYGPRNRDFYRENPKGRELARWKYQEYMKDYLRCITAVDENVGRVLDYLEKAGLKENTLVIYSSDQGFYLGEHGWFDKRFMYEESLRWPLLVRYPAEIKPAINRNDMVLNLDMAPTFLDYAGAPVPADMQGRSLRSILKGSTPADWRQSIYYHYFEYPAVHGVKRHYGIRTHHYKLIHFYYDVDYWELYDLQKDPHELRNVYDDPAYTKIVERLKKELQKLREQYHDTDVTRFLPQQSVQVDHLARGCAVSLQWPYAARYPGGGPNGLTNGETAPFLIREPVDLKLWQGFEGNDLAATIDLGEKKVIREIKAGFLSLERDWIFLPLSVSLSISDDGSVWRKIATQAALRQTDSDIAEKVTVTFPLQDELACFIRIQAVNRGICPPEHPGAGGKAWVFADEIIVH